MASTHTRRYWILPVLSLVLAGPAVGQEGSTMKIRLTIDGKAIDATLLDNATARDFHSLLPLTLTLEDYASTEKISYLKRKLSTDGAPTGVDPAPGDIAYYALWGNVAIFYKDAPYARGLVRIGRIDSGMEPLSVRGRAQGNDYFYANRPPEVNTMTESTYRNQNAPTNCESQTRRDFMVTAAAAGASVGAAGLFHLPVANAPSTKANGPYPAEGMAAYSPTGSHELI